MGSRLAHALSVQEDGEVRRIKQPLKPTTYTAYCLLPTTYYLLPTTSYLLPET